MDERTDDLIQKAVDGALAPDDRAALDAALAADRDARASMESIEAIARALDALPQLEAPPMLAAKVLHSVRAREGRRAGSPALPHAVRRRMLLVAGYAAAAGLFLGLIAAPLLMRADLFRGAQVPAGVAGAMGTAEISSWDLVSRRSVASRGGTVTLVVRRSGSSYAVDAAAEARPGAAASIAWDASRMDLLALVRDRAAGEIAVSPGLVRWRIAEGGGVTLVLVARGEPGIIHLDVDGNRLFSSDLSPGNGRK